jgi:hypothetical protein
MEDPNVRARSPATLRRVSERNRLAREFMSDAYEYLLPVVRCRCGEFRSGARDHWSDASDQGSGTDGRARCAGGGS